MAWMALFSSFCLHIDWVLLSCVLLADEAWHTGITGVDVKVGSWHALEASLGGVGLTGGAFTADRGCVTLVRNGVAHGAVVALRADLAHSDSCLFVDRTVEAWWAELWLTRTDRAEVAFWALVLVPVVWGFSAVAWAEVSFGAQVAVLDL